jgi:hypothetical protein
LVSIFHQVVRLLGKELTAETQRTQRKKREEKRREEKRREEKRREEKRREETEVPHALQLSQSVGLRKCTG